MPGSFPLATITTTTESRVGPEWRRGGNRYQVARLMLQQLAATRGAGLDRMLIRLELSRPSVSQDAARPGTDALPAAVPPSLVKSEGEGAWGEPGVGRTSFLGRQVSGPGPSPRRVGEPRVGQTPNPAAQPQRASIIHGSIHGRVLSSAAATQPAASRPATATATAWNCCFCSRKGKQERIAHHVTWNYWLPEPNGQPSVITHPAASSPQQAQLHLSIAPVCNIQPPTNKRPHKVHFQ